MSIESYAIHIAPRGGKIDLIVDEISTARQAAHDKRIEYSKAKGAIGVYQTDRAVSGLLFPAGASLPEGWVKSHDDEDGIVAELKATGRTKEARAAHKARVDEMAALPKKPGADEFTKRIGTDWKMVYAGPGRGLSLLKCWYERLGEVTFVMTPWTTQADEHGENIHEKPPTEKTRIAFLPEGCERVPLSRYYQAKEATAA